MSALEQSAEKWPFNAGGGGVVRPLRPSPLATGLSPVFITLTVEDSD